MGPSFAALCQNAAPNDSSPRSPVGRDSIMSRLDGSSYKMITGKWYKTPKEIWGFRTRRRRGSPRQVAEDFLDAEQKLLEIGPMLPRLRLRRIRHGLGAD